ncbi:response regulator transcription factor [Xylophilus sp. ASV27]|uniref:response regulator transcription factor n=1 Tax=Xylophilus sp. ASV27 TaxID=2795129 RepID=UPI0018EB4064|nr:response regulator transcription factor [Xylophilus sp. ASV27]
MRIAILEDDSDHAEALVKPLERLGHTCFVCRDGRDFVRSLSRESYHLFVLDWQVPNLSGLVALDWIRRHLPRSIPVLFVTSRDQEEDIVQGLEAGADDYMIKPVRAYELTARVRALLRRAYPTPELESAPAVGAYVFDLHRREVRVAGVPVVLKPKEYALALFLFRNMGRLLSHQHLLSEVWGLEGVDSRTVATHMSQLRRKLAFGPQHGVRLMPVYGLGYRFEPVQALAAQP